MGRESVMEAYRCVPPPATLNGTHRAISYVARCVPLSVGVAVFILVMRARASVGKE
jgi:hypothetical protein